MVEVTKVISDAGSSQSLKSGRKGPA